MQLENIADLVRPRAFDSRSNRGEPVLLEELIANRLLRGERGCMSLLGGAGSGKSTAMRYLARRFAGHPELRLVDGERVDDCPATSPHALVVCAAEQASSWDDVAPVELAPWGRDEVIEYLLVAHKTRCGELLRRFEAGGQEAAAGNPALICLTLDAMALHDDIGDVFTAVSRKFEQITPDDEERRRLRRDCLLRQTHLWTGTWRPSNPLLRLNAVRDRLGAEALVERLAAGATPEALRGTIAAGLRHAIVLALQGSEPARNRLFAIADAEIGSVAVRHSAVPVHAIELLNEADHGSIARWIALRTSLRQLLPCLRGLRLPGVRLEGAQVAELDLEAALLAGAQLGQCDLSRASLVRAVLDGADLQGATLRGSKANQASLQRAKLRGADADDAVWDGVDLRDADAREARFESASLHFACLAGADFTGVIFAGADLRHANVEGALLVDVDFAHARLDSVKLNQARLASRMFDAASMEHCCLDGVVLNRASFRAANLTGATLTGSRLHEASFEKANLESAGLADVDWEGADLRGANLKHASFHMGSSRSGLVFHAAPMEGSRTGFYTDEFLNAGYKPPEEIRKANLCRADLRGAAIGEADFYLVDLRGAQYDAEQEQHLRRCGAILDDWGKR